MSDALDRIWVEPDLTVELKFLRDKIETRTGRKLDGGVPAASKLAAKILKNYRLKQIKKVQVTLEKKDGTKKDTIFYLP